MGRLSRLLLLVQLLTHINESISNPNYMEEGQDLIDNYIIPRLKNNYNNLGGHFDLSKMHICVCTLSWGCDHASSGWVPHVLDPTNSTFREKWQNTCVTDGDCVQMAAVVENELKTVYGCIDLEYKKRDFFTALNVKSDLCRNDTTNDTKSPLWICCESGNYCANQTMLIPEYLKQSPKQYWLVFVLVVLVLIALLGLCYFVYNRCKLRGRERVPADNTVTNNGNADVNILLEPINSREVSHDAPSTAVSTMDEQNILQPQSALRNNPNARLFNQIESTDGTSGAGPLQLQPRSLAHCLKRNKVIGQGRFGAVYHGQYNNEEVAVKAFHSSDEASYSTEVKIYQIGMLRHPNVLRYIANDRVDTPTGIEPWLVTEYHAPGSLYDFLQNNVLDLRTCYDMIRSTANGLAFLHHEMKTTSGLTKPAIVHRDLKTRNIMVKEDMTCAIGDFGLSVSAGITGASQSDGENEKNGVDADLAEDRFGTTRYLAPEILNRTMGPNRFEAFRMADVYSFMLCCWEIMSRTSDGEIVAVSPDQAIPYIEHVERDPTWEEMRELVAVQCVRPTHNPLWSQKSEFSHLYDIVRGSWVSHPAARLTAYNFRSRIDTLQSDVFGSHSTRHVSERNGAEAARAEKAPLLDQNN